LFAVLQDTRETVRRERRIHTVYQPDHLVDENHHKSSAFFALNSTGTHAIAAVMHDRIEKQKGVHGETIYLRLSSDTSLLWILSCFFQTRDPLYVTAGGRWESQTWCLCLLPYPLWWFKLILVLAVICASGTILTNLWTDIYGFVDFLAGHPFDTEQEFIRVFITHYGSRIRDPLPTARDRLIKFLMAVTVSHPASIMKLKNVKHELIPFVLGMSSEDHVLCWTAKFYEALRFCKAPGLGAI
jgi:hypothetical protein